MATNKEKLYTLADLDFRIRGVHQFLQLFFTFLQILKSMHDRVLKSQLKKNILNIKLTLS